MRYHPERAAELMEYSHVIHDAAMTFTWLNIYRYDKDFRIHMSHHNDRSWAKILTKAYQFRLKDRLTVMRHEMNDNTGNKKCEICHKFNKGKCTYGLRCKYDHRCLICNKWGHGAHSCCCAHSTGITGNDKFQVGNHATYIDTDNRIVKVQKSGFQGVKREASDIKQ